MGLRERFERGGRDDRELSEAARRERAAARAQDRAARRARGPAARRIGAAARERVLAARKEPGPQARRVLDVATGVLGEAGRVLLEVFVLVAEAWMAVAELAGRFVLAIWLRVLPPALAIGRAGLAGLRLAERRVQPAHGTLAVAATALVVLVVSQFVDYRGVSVGTGEYAGGVELVAPAPEVDRERTGDAHAWVMLPIAAAGFVVLGLAVLRRRGVARLLVGVGVAVLAIALLVDVPSGLDEGSAAVAYEGAKAGLLEGFWAQTFAGAALIACGILLPFHLGALGTAAGSPDGSSTARGKRAPGRSRPKAASA